MKKMIFILLLLFFTFWAFSQEVVVFKDERSMVVRSHYEKEGFVYLRLDSGEIAVLKKQIKEIRNENVTVTSSVTSQSFTPEKVPIPMNVDSGKRLKVTERKAAPPHLIKRNKPDLVDNEDDDDDDEGIDDDEDEDEDEPVNPQQPNVPPQPPTLPQKPTRNLTPVIRKR